MNQSAVKKLELITIDEKILDQAILTSHGKGKVQVSDSNFINSGYYLTSLENMEGMARLMAKKKYNGRAFEIKTTKLKNHKSYSQK